MYRNILNVVTKMAINSSKGNHLNLVSRALCSSVANTKFETLSVTSPGPFIVHVQLNRPDKLNTFNDKMWKELQLCFNGLHVNEDCRVVVLSAAGKHFTGGIDLRSMLELGQTLGEIDEVARKGYVLEKMIKCYQDSISSLEECSKPVIAAVHSACVGAGVDLISAADIRYCSKDAWFQVKEVDIGMPADVGTLQRLPKVIGSQSLVRELCFTGRKFDSKEASNCGLVSKVFDDKESMLKDTLNIAAEIASKSPLAVQATKRNIIYSMDHTNQQGLDHIREINKLLLQGEDFVTACMAQATKGEKPVFAKL